MASSVEFEPVPAMIGTRLLANLMHSSITRSCSAVESVGDSPVVPQGTMPLVPFLIWNSTSCLRAASSILPFLKGVTMATIEPLNIEFPLGDEFSGTFEPDIHDPSLLQTESDFQRFPAARHDV